ncbi:hypothetical protein [Fibrella aquatilis]|uniref:Uncharacterized protein n=1 Tax=Fibrella aquatilis TaxID=2817059 RepID=A0A939JUG5_9BACT|nr:hypothetical protein [Fibrella aquatilis]MBO0929752.1 hypothetical protein [Fibrella aquatilis]
MHNPEDYEYDGRQSKYPPVWQLLGYFGLGIGGVILSFDRLAEFTAFEKPVLMNRLQPMIRVHWFEKILYELGGKYLVFGVFLVFSLVFVGFGIWRLSSWFRLRNSR